MLIPFCSLKSHLRRNLELAGDEGRTQVGDDAIRVRHFRLPDFFGGSVVFSLQLTEVIYCTLNRYRLYLRLFQSCITYFLRSFKAFRIEAFVLGIESYYLPSRSYGFPSSALKLLFRSIATRSLPSIRLSAILLKQRGDCSRNDCCSSYRRSLRRTSN